MSKKNSKNKKGFIALMSVIILSVLLIVVTFTLSTSAFFTRFNVLNSEYKNISSNIADGCVDVALLNLINDHAYDPTNETVTIGTNTCTIVSITPLSSPRTIKVQSIYPETGSKRSYTNLEVVVTQTMSSMVVNSWKEVPHF